MNQLLKKQCGVIDFFENENDYLRLKQQVETSHSVVGESHVEYGDFQTNKKLALTITKLLLNKQINPEFLIEPTCGKGSFILSAIQTMGVKI
jgi:hypothetical protein